MAASHDNDKKTILRINEKKMEFNESIKKIGHGVGVAFLVAALTVVYNIYLYATNEEVGLGPYILVEGAFGAALFVSVGLFAKRNPSLWMTIGLGFYLAYQVLLIVLDPATVANGLIMKGIIIYGLGRGFLGARNLKKEERALKEMGVSPREVNQALKNLEELRRTPHPKTKEEPTVPDQGAAPAAQPDQPITKNNHDV